MAKHHVALQGCDDSTHFDINLTPTEMTVVHRLMAHIDLVRHGGCKPILVVDPEDCSESCFYADED